MAEQVGRTVPESVAAKLYAASDLIASKGLEKTKIEDIAAASGVPKATLYYYFAGKDDILAFLLRDSLAAIASDVADAAGAPGSGRDRLAAVIATQIEHTMSRPGSSRALVGDLGRAIRLPDLTAAVQHAFYDPIATVLHAGAEDGSLRALADPAGAAVTIFGAVMLSAMLHNVQDSDKSVREVVDGVLDLIMSGLATSD